MMWCCILIRTYTCGVAYLYELIHVVLHTYTNFCMELGECVKIVYTSGIETIR